MENIFTILAQAQAAAPEAASQGGGLNFVLIMVLMVAAMYFLMIAPQRKRQKQHKLMIDSLKTGDEVVTIGGAFGTIANVKEKSFVVRLGDNMKVEFLKSAVQEKISSESAPVEVQK